MKKSLLIIATVVLTIFNLQATNSIKSNPIKVNPLNSKVIKIYDWKLKLEDGTFSGTSRTKEEAQKVLQLLSKGEFVIQKQISSYYVFSNESQMNKYRTYYWEVQSENSHAKGFASSKEKASQLIRLVAKGDILHYKIIKSKSK